MATVLEFGKIVKNSVEREGMLGWQFNTVGVSDAITMGGDGKAISLRQMIWVAIGANVPRHALLAANS